MSTSSDSDPAPAASSPGMDATESLVLSRMREFLDSFHLGALQRAAVQRFVQRRVADPANTKCDRVRKWLMACINRRPPMPSETAQVGCPEIIPLLKAQAVWDLSELPGDLESLITPDVVISLREELLRLRRRTGEGGRFQPYRSPSAVGSGPAASDAVGREATDTGHWNVLYLRLHTEDFSANRDACPVAADLLSRLERSYDHAFFSALSPGAHILKHHGPTNKKLRVHIPLVGVEGTRMRVGDSWIYPEEGVPYVFDDSFEHEVWHDGPATRIVLIFDIWHPELSTEEVSLLTTLRNSKLRFEKLQSQHDSSGDNFFSIIERSRRLLNANSDWWVAAPEDEEREDPSTATDLIITGRNCAIGAGGGSSSSACVSLPALRAGSRERDPLVSGRDRLGASAVPRVGASSGWDFRVSPSASAPVAASASSASGLAATVGGQGERQVPTGAIGFEGGGNVEDPSSASGPSPNCDNYFVLNASGSSTLSDNASVGPN